MSDPDWRCIAVVPHIGRQSRDDPMIGIKAMISPLSRVMKCIGADEVREESSGCKISWALSTRNVRSFQLNN